MPNGLEAFTSQKVRVCTIFLGDKKLIEWISACTSFGFPANNTECLNSHNASSILYTETSVNSSIVAANDRQWQWFLCNEPFFYWQE